MKFMDMISRKRSEKPVGHDTGADIDPVPLEQVLAAVRAETQPAADPVDIRDFAGQAPASNARVSTRSFLDDDGSYDWDLEELGETADAVPAQAAASAPAPVADDLKADAEDDWDDAWDDAEDLSDEDDTEDDGGVMTLTNPVVGGTAETDDDAFDDADEMLGADGDDDMAEAAEPEAEDLRITSIAETLRAEMPKAPVAPETPASAAPAATTQQALLATIRAAREKAERARLASEAGAVPATPEAAERPVTRPSLHAAHPGLDDGADDFEFAGDDTPMMSAEPDMEDDIAAPVSAEARDDEDDGYAEDQAWAESEAATADDDADEAGDDDAYEDEAFDEAAEDDADETLVAAADDEDEHEYDDLAAADDVAGVEEDDEEEEMATASGDDWDDEEVDVAEEPPVAVAPASPKIWDMDADPAPVAAEDEDDADWDEDGHGEDLAASAPRDEDEDEIYRPAARHDDAGAAASALAASAMPRRRAGRVKTRLLGFNKPAQADPISQAMEQAVADGPTFPVGWIVVVKGPGRGASFALSAGASKIGRGDDQAVRLDFGDTSISRDNHAVIAYDDEQRKFFLGHGGKANLVRLNDMPVLATETITDGDLIRIGETTLRLVALCGPEFTWAEDEAGSFPHAAAE